MHFCRDRCACIHQGQVDWPVVGRPEFARFVVEMVDIIFEHLVVIDDIPHLSVEAEKL